MKLEHAIPAVGLVKARHGIAVCADGYESHPTKYETDTYFTVQAIIIKKQCY